MRFERTGKVDPLSPKWRAFLLEALGGIDLDETQSAEARRPDFACLSGLLVVEMKTLEEDGSERMENLTKELQNRPDWPEFYGSAPVQAMAHHMDDPEAVIRKFIDRMGRAIINHLKKANKQLGAHAAAFPRKNQVRVMLLINEDHELFEPAAVTYVLRHALQRRENGKPLYPNIDAVIYTTERHASVRNAQLVFPLMSIEGPGLETAVWKRDVIDAVFERWGRWNEIPVLHGRAKDTDFTTIEEVPERMARHDYWRLEYRRNPYMQGISDEALRDRFDESILITTLKMVKNSPLKPDEQTVEAAIRAFTHIMLEMSKRGITQPQFSLEPTRLALAAKRLSFPDPVIDWARRNFNRQKD